MRGHAAFLVLSAAALLAGALVIRGPVREITLEGAGVAQGVKARHQKLTGSDDLALGSKPIGVQPFGDFPDNWSTVESGGVIGPTWVLGTYDSTRAPAVAGHRVAARTQKLAEDWLSTHHKFLRRGPNAFAQATQENGPDSEPMSLAHLYTSPDAPLIHSAAVAAGAASEDGGWN